MHFNFSIKDLFAKYSRSFLSIPTDLFQFMRLCVLVLQESRHDKEKSEKKEKRESSGGKEEKKQYP